MPVARSSTRRLPWWRSYVGPPGRARAEPGHRAGDAVEVPAEVLAAEALRGSATSPPGAEHPLDRVAEDPDDRLGVVDHRRHAPLVVDLGVHAVRRDDLARPASGPASRPPPRRRRRASAPCPPSRPVAGMTLCAAPARTIPHTTLTPARGSRRRDRIAGSSVIDLAEREGEVLGQVRARGVAARPAEPDVEAVGGAGERALAEARPGRRRGWGRSAGRRSGRRRRGRPARSAQRAAGHDLLGGLEEQPDPTGEQALRRGPRPRASAGADEARWCARRGRTRGRPRRRCSPTGPRWGPRPGSASRSARSATTGPPSPSSAIRPLRGSR